MLTPEPNHRAVYAHPAFPPPKHPDVTLWRYLDIHKFDWLVAHRRLFMPAADLLGEPLEGTAPDGHLKSWRAEAEKADTATQRKIIEANQKLLSRFANNFRSNYFVSCWHMSECESDDMWRCYTTTPEAVVVKTTFRALRASLPEYVEIGMVRYLDYASARLPSMNMFEYITHKNINFSFEKEVRAVAFPPATEGLGSARFQGDLFASEAHKGRLVFAPVVDISVLIHGVVLHPASTPQFVARVCSTCEIATLPKPVASAI